MKGIVMMSPTKQLPWKMFFLLVCFCMGCGKKELGPVDYIERSADGIQIIGSALTDSEIAGIKRAVDKYAADEAGSQKDMSKSILAIHHTGPDEAAVRIGKMEGPAKGRGRDFRVRREHASWRVFEASSWRG